MRVIYQHLDRQKNWQTAKLNLTQLHAQIAARQGGQRLDLSTEAIAEQIHQTQEERL